MPRDSRTTPESTGADGPAAPTPEIHEDPGHPHDEFWEAIRQHRAHRRRLRVLGSKKRRAIITMVHNEPVFLPIWLRYYSRFFAAEDIYVLDHDTSDGSTSGGGFVRLPVSHDSVDHAWMVATVEELQHRLLEIYDVVLVTDVDEIVAPIPERGTLGSYLDEFDEEYVTCIGYEILHLPDREPPLEPERGILEQRGYWFANDAYDKPALATVPMSWKPGFHKRADEAFEWDPDLVLVHLHRVDYEICKQRHRIRSRRPWAEPDQAQAMASHNKLVEGEAFDRWFFSATGWEEQGIAMLVERIPASWREVF